MKRINVVIADAQEIVRTGIRYILEHSHRYRIKGEAQDAEQALELASAKRPRLILIDPQRLNPHNLSIVQVLRKIYPDLRIVIITQNDDEEYFRNAVKYGADGYFLKSCSSHDLLDGLEIILNGSQYFGVQISRKLITESILQDKKINFKESFLSKKLTKREIEILKNITLGLTNSKIAEKLFISDRTVHNHRTNLMRKLNVHNTADMVRIALEEGMLDGFSN